MATETALATRPAVTQTPPWSAASVSRPLSRAGMSVSLPSLRPRSRGSFGAKGDLWGSLGDSMSTTCSLSGKDGLSTPTQALRPDSRSSRARPATQGGLAPPGSRRAQAAALLRGVSSSAELCNARAQSGLRALASEGGADGRDNTAARPRSSNMTSFAALFGACTPLDEQAFLKLTEGVGSKLDNCWSFHSEFSGRPGDATRVAGSPTKANRRDGEDAATRRAEEREKRLERLEAYRMARRIEPELPPLTIEVDEQSTAHSKVDQRFLKLNAAPEQLMSQTLACRIERVKILKQLRDQRREKAANNREAYDSRLEEQRLEFFAKKRRQASKFQPAPKTEAMSASDSMTSTSDASLRDWLTFACALWFAAQLNGGLKFSQLSAEERMRRIASAGSRPIPGVPDTAAQAEELNAFLAKARSCPQVVMVAAIWRGKLRVRRQRTAATRVFHVLTQWQVAGRFFYACRRFMSNAIKLQRWWRTWQTWHRAVVKDLSRRWEQVERQEIGHLVAARVQQAAARDNEARRGSKTQPIKLTLDDYYDLECVQLPDRLEFIENELRARRYMLLPKIHLWEEDVQRWHQQRMELRICNEVNETLGATTRAGPVFSWPPVRPSYLVPERGQAGAAGNQEILSWVRIAQKNPQGWSVIPTKHDRDTQSRSRQQRAPSRGRATRAHNGPPQKPSPFGEAPPDEEMAKWGMDLASMPFLSEQTGAALSQV